MALLDRANTAAYGHPEITRVPLGVRDAPGILITGHDLKDMEELLEQTEGTGVDVYTHCEMLPAHYYPAFKKYPHLAGNYGNAWWNQEQDFATFRGPILVTSNCIVPVADAYRDRIFTTGAAGYPGVPHIGRDPATGRKDFSALIGWPGAARPRSLSTMANSSAASAATSSTRWPAGSSSWSGRARSGTSWSWAAATAGTRPATTTARWPSGCRRTP